MVVKIGKKLKSLSCMLSELDNIYQSLLKATDISEGEYLVMFAISELGEGCSQKDISDNIFGNKKTVNSTVKKLQSDGLIELKPAKYPNMQIFLTEKGRQYMRTNIIPILEIENKTLEKIDDQEFECILNCYNKYVKYFKEDVEEYIKIGINDKS